VGGGLTSVNNSGYDFREIWLPELQSRGGWMANTSRAEVPITEYNPLSTFCVAINSFR